MARSKLPVLLPAAKRDVKKAYEWYEEQKPGLGEMFLERVEECLRAIGRSPKAFQLVAKDARRAIVKQFPYAIFYRIEAKPFSSIRSFIPRKIRKNGWIDWPI